MYSRLVIAPEHESARATMCDEELLTTTPPPPLSPSTSSWSLALGERGVRATGNVEQAQVGRIADVREQVPNVRGRRIGELRHAPDQGAGCSVEVRACDRAVGAE